MSDSISRVYDDYDNYKRACVDAGFIPNSIYGKWDEDKPGANNEREVISRPRGIV